MSDQTPGAPEPQAPVTPEPAPASPPAADPPAQAEGPSAPLSRDSANSTYAPSEQPDLDPTAGPHVEQHLGYTQ